MSCEQAYREYLKALKAKTPIEEELTALLLSLTNIPGEPVQLPMPRHEMLGRAAQLMREKKAAVQRFHAALDAWFEAAKRHCD
ncbi:unnamed protein product [marine sediment metagenome]|uniref:Uncharacterized protein n=1 Tax=marine sediment metagenome TaxID=412755 RepID=X0VG97_9ZZZZ